MLIFNFLQMKKFFKILFFCILFVPNFVNADSSQVLNIYTEKNIYSYGDFLTFTIQVSEVTEQFGILYVIDENGKKSSAIPIEIIDLETLIPSPFPFESAVYPLGKYTLEVQYSGSVATTDFELIDSGKIVIPSWIREFAKYWYNGAISDLEFASSIEFLIKEEIIIVPYSENKTSEIIIPKWIKTSTGWWIDRIISDKEYAQSLEYLIKAGIIVV